VRCDKGKPRGSPHQAHCYGNGALARSPFPTSLDLPSLRQRSQTLAPASCSLSATMIYSWLKQPFLISAILLTGVPAELLEQVSEQGDRKEPDPTAVYSGVSGARHWVLFVVSSSESTL